MIEDTLMYLLTTRLVMYWVRFIRTSILESIVDSFVLQSNLLVSTCVDDFDLARTQGFVEMVTEKLSATLDVSKVEDDSFRFTGIDIKQVDGIEISMEDYARV